MPTATNVKEIFDSMCTRFRPEKAGSDSATFQFDLSGADGGKYWIFIRCPVLQIRYCYFIARPARVRAFRQASLILRW